MLIRIFTIIFDTVYGGFNDQEIREFSKDKQIISTDHYFFEKNNSQYLILVLKYYSFLPDSNISSNSVSLSKNQNKSKNDSGGDYKSLLSEVDMGLFNIFRDWRTQRCKKEGVPPYIIFTNLQLVPDSP